MPLPKQARFVLVALMATSLLAIPQASIAARAPAVTPPNLSSVTAYGCNYAYFKGFTEGAYPVKGGVLVEYDVQPVLMQLTFCSSGGGVTSTAVPPKDAPQYGYASMGGVSTSIGTVLVLDSDNPPGFWFCEGATSSGCGIISTWIGLPPGFCSSEPKGICHPFGIALDKKLNVYYADPVNAQVVKCTFISGYSNCAVFESLSGSPAGIFRASNGDVWVTDNSCTGNVWKNGVSQFTFGDQVQGITISSSNYLKTPHVYFATTGACFYGFAFVYDLTDHTILTPLGSPFSGPGQIPSITTKLQFTTNATEVVYLIKDGT